MTISVSILEALEARGLDVELAVKLGFESERRDGTEFLVIPCLRNGRVYRRKLRTLGAEKRFSQDGDGPIPWNEDVLNDASLAPQPLIVTEGELDALAAIQCGYQRTISVPDGAPMESSPDPFDQKRYAWVRELKPRLGREFVAEIILATDGDGPGHALMQDLAVMLGRFRCKFLTYPLAADGHRLKDLNEVLLAYGQQGVVETINRAAFLQTDGVYRMSELPELPPSRSYTSGFALLDEHYRVRLGDFAVVTGIPSHGKSSFVNDFLCRIVEREKWRVAWASFEQEPKRDHRRALRTWFLEEAPHKANPDRVDAADAWIDAHHCFIAPGDDDDVTLEWMLERMEQAVVQRDCQVIVIDPWNEMDHMRDRSETETEYVGRAIKRFKRFAKAFQVHLIVVAHPAKMRRDEHGKIPMPNLYDISGSAAFNNKADVGVVVYRQDEENTIIKIAKSRYHGEIGRPGSVRMQFSKDDLRYREIERVS